jgi:hypothetical protein
MATLFRWLEKRLKAFSAPLCAPTSTFTTNFTEVLSGDDVQLEYYEDSYPKLPACLDWRPKRRLAEAA